MPRVEVFDTSVLIPFFNRGAYESDIRAAIRSERMRLASLVALELYAGTRDVAEKRALDSFTGSFARRGLVLTPTHEDHVTAGQLLARGRRLAGASDVRDHLVDVLIMLSAARVRGTVVSANIRHMQRWVSLARRTGCDVRVRLPREIRIA